MARQKAYTVDELLDATEVLLIERGYEGFHLKGLSEMLCGARSTIYEYYSNKEEIVAACMLRMLRRIIAASEHVDELPTFEAVKRVFEIFLEQSGFHQLMMKAPKVNVDASERAKRDMELLDRGHKELKEKLMIIFSRAQQEGLVRNDIALPVVVSIFFHAIDTPNWTGIPAPVWTEQLFDILWKGVSAAKLTR